MIKPLLKRTIFSSLYHSGLTGIFIKKFLRYKKSLPIVILIYHRISDNLNNEINKDQTINHPVENFTAEMRFLRKHFDIISLDEAVEYMKHGIAPLRPTVAITFDDGYEDNYKYAFPVLKSLKIPATFFLTTGFIDTYDLPLVEKMGQAILKTGRRRLKLRLDSYEFSCEFNSICDKRRAFEQIRSQVNRLRHDEAVILVNEIVKQLGDFKSDDVRMMTWNQVKEMSRNNLSFGAHTVTHPVLSKISAKAAKMEIAESKMVIEKMLDLPVKHFAFPFGSLEHFNGELKEYCKKIGFVSISSAVYGVNGQGADAYSLKRLSPGETVPIFAANVARAFIRSGYRRS